MCSPARGLLWLRRCYCLERIGILLQPLWSCTRATATVFSHRTSHSRTRSSLSSVGQCTEGSRHDGKVEGFAVCKRRSHAHYRWRALRCCCPEFCSFGDAILTFTAELVGKKSLGLLDTLMKTEWFLPETCWKSLEVLLYKLLGDTSFKHALALSFVSHYSFFLRERFTYPALTLKLVKESDLLDVLLGTLKEFFCASSVQENDIVSMQRRCCWKQVLHLRRVATSESAMAHSSVAGGGVHPLAASGFNADQSVYELARPSYPAAVVELVKREIVPALGDPASASSLSVLDLAAGTGKWTRLILSFGIGQLVAVEPSPGMRAQFQQLCPGVAIVDGSGTAIPLPDASVDVIFIAQAFHWFSNVAALTEMHRVLKKEGTVVMIWNMEDRRTAWVARLREAYETHEAGSPQYRLGLWRRPFEEPEMVKEVSRMFQLPFQERQVSHFVLNTRSNVWQRVLSKSYIAVLGAEEKEELKKEVDQILAGPDIHWDSLNDDKMLQYPYNTDVVWFKKL